VLDREMIHASGARNLSELFRLIPGFQVGMQSGNQPLVTYHGLADEAPRRMLVQVDGRSVYSPYFISGVEWNQIGVDIDDIERIEVFRGSNSAAYGSNAFLGVANLITRPASESRGAAARYRAGDNGVNDLGVRVGRQFDDVDLRLTASRNADQGFSDLNDWSRAELATLRADWALSIDNQIEFQVGWMHNELGTGKAGNLTDPPRGSEISTTFGLLRWRHAPAPGEELSLTYYHQQENGRDAYPLDVEVIPRLSGLPVAITIPFNFDYGFDTQRDDLEIQSISALAPSVRAVAGAGWRVDRVHSALRFGTDDSIRDEVRHAFGTLEWRASSNWLFNLGAMVEHNSLTGSSLAPRISANYHLSEVQTWRVVANRSYRNPSAFEQKSDMIFRNSAAFATPIGTIPAGTAMSQTFRPSPGLEAEHITSYELGYLAELRPLATTLDVRVFLEKARKLIEMRLENSTQGLLPRDNVRFFDNGGQADIHGLEVSATYRPALQTWVNVTHTELRIDGPTLSATPALTQPNMYVGTSAPQHTTTLFAAWEFLPAWQFSTTKRWVGAMAWYQDDAHRVPMYRQLDARLAHRFRVSGGRGEIALVAQNVDGPEQTYAPDTSSWGSRVFAALSLEY
jgi:iron complex outermembrane receptor protein